MSKSKKGQKKSSKKGGPGSAGAEGNKPAKVPTKLRRDVSRTLRIPLDDKAKAKTMEKLMGLLAAQERVDADRKTASAVFAGQLKEIGSELKETRAQVEEGMLEEVACEEIKDFKKNEIKVIRKDNKEVVEGPRAMTEADRQLAFDDHTDATDDGEATAPEPLRLGQGNGEVVDAEVVEEVPPQE